MSEQDELSKSSTWIEKFDLFDLPIYNFCRDSESKFDLVLFCETMVQQNKMKYFYKILTEGKRTPAKVNVQKMVIDKLIENGEISTKKLMDLCSNLNLSTDHFPFLTMVQDKKVVNRHLGQYLKISSACSEYRGLNRVEELYFGQPRHLAVISTKLWENGKPVEAKGIQIRNDLEMEHFEDTNKGQWIIGTEY